MTYGWAILIVVIVVGALYALGLTQPCKWVGTQIREFADFKVENPSYSATADTLSFDLSRLKPDSVALNTVTLGGDVTGSLNATGASVNNTKAARYTVTSAASAKNAGDCYSADVTLTYDVTTAAGATSFTTSGKVSGVAV
jgi:hypothetical protein